MARFYSSANEKWFVYALKSLLPLSCCMILLLLGVSLPSATRWEGLSILLPFLGVYYWALHGADYFPPLLALVIGFWLDLLIGEAIGLYGLIFLICYIACRMMHHFFGENALPVLLSGFLLLGSVPVAIHVAVTKTTGHDANFGELLLSLVISTLLYFPAYLVFDWLRRKLW